MSSAYSPDGWQRWTFRPFHIITVSSNPIAQFHERCALYLVCVQGASEVSLQHMDGVHLELDDYEDLDAAEGSLARFTSLRSLSLRTADFCSLDSLSFPSGLRYGHDA